MQGNNPQSGSTLSLHFGFPVRDRIEASPQAQGKRAFATASRSLTVGETGEADDRY